MTTAGNQTLREKLAAGRFVRTVEFTPPRGTQVATALADIRRVAPCFDAVNLTDCSGARLRMNAIMFSSLVQREVGIETIFHYTCRDRNLLALQADLLGAAALNVRNVLTLGGDSPEKGDHPQAKGVFDLDSVGLIRLAEQLNQGTDWNGNPLEGGTDLFIGAAANPGAADLDLELERMAAKIEAGARFFQTQPVFDLARLEQFHARAAGLGAHILYAVLPLPGERSVRFLQKMGVSVPDPVVQRIRDGGPQAGLTVAREAALAATALGSGLHIYPWGGNLDAVITLGCSVAAGADAAATAGD